MKTGTDYINENKSNFRMKNRIEKINALASAFNVSTDEIVVVENNAWQWAARSNRTDAEKRAVKIGQTNDTLRGHSVETVFAYVK